MERPVAERRIVLKKPHESAVKCYQNHNSTNRHADRVLWNNTFHKQTPERLADAGRQTRGDCQEGERGR